MTLPIQRCAVCDAPTGRCAEDAIWLPPKDPNADGIGPLCEGCAEEMWPSSKDQPATAKEG